MRWLLKYEPFLLIAPFMTRIQGVGSAFEPWKAGSTTFSSLSYNERAPCEVSVSLISQPVTPSMHPSIHQPSSTERLGTPFRAAFMPLVPEASSGRNGVLSHTSEPD